MSKNSTELEQELPKFICMIQKPPCGREGYRCSLFPVCTSEISSVWKYPVSLHTHMCPLCSGLPFHQLPWDKICKDVVDFISHTSLFNLLLCIRNQGLHWSLGKNVLEFGKAVCPSDTAARQRSAARVQERGPGCRVWCHHLQFNPIEFPLGGTIH